MFNDVYREKLWINLLSLLTTFNISNCVLRQTFRRINSRKKVTVPAFLIPEPTSNSRERIIKTSSLERHDRLFTASLPIPSPFFSSSRLSVISWQCVAI